MREKAVLLGNRLVQRARSFLADAGCSPVDNQHPRLSTHDETLREGHLSMQETDSCIVAKGRRSTPSTVRDKASLDAHHAVLLITQSEPARFCLTRR